MNAVELCQNMSTLSTQGLSDCLGLGNVLQGGPWATVQWGWDPCQANAELSSGCCHPFPQPCLPSPSPAQALGTKSCSGWGWGVPGAGAEGWEPPSRVAPSELEHSNYAGGFMSLCL